MSWTIANAIVPKFPSSSNLEGDICARVGFDFALALAVEGFTKSLAMELGPHGIRVNSIAPTVIETPLAKEMLKDSEFRNAVISKIKLGRIGEVEDLMGAIVFLASDAARMITGASLLIDGGWTIG